MRKFLQLLLLVTLSQIAGSAAEGAKDTINITATPKFEHRGEWVYLLIADSKHNFDIAWSMPPRFSLFPVSLQTNRTYTFTVLEEPYKDIKVPKVIRVRQDDKVIYDQEICELHGTQMEYKTVRIAYGLIRPKPGEPSGEDEKRLFPHRREISFGGCCVEPDSPKTEKVFVCGQCKAAYENWKKEHPNTKK